MKYYLTKITDGEQKFLEISENDYNEIVLSKDNLFQALFIEQKLDLLIENYAEYEIELFKLTACQMLFHDQTYTSFSMDLNLISRRIVNFLTAARLYIDQISHNYSSIYGEENDKLKIIKKIKSEEYDKNLYYRIIEAMRNYVQHRGSPLHSCTYHSKRIEENSDLEGSLCYTISPYLSKQELKSDKKFKKSVLNEIEALNGNYDKIDLKPIIRGFISSIGNIHKKVRELLRDDINSWENFILAKSDLFNKKFGIAQGTLSLNAAIYDKNGVFQDSIYLFKDYWDRRKSLEQKNRYLESLPDRFITTQSFKMNA
jgi:hypothetical protein